MLFIFDWDGTLSDSTAKIVRCMQAAAARQGLQHRSDESVKNIIGLGLPEAIKTLYPDATEAVVSALKATYSEVYTREDTTPSPFFPGVEETLHLLRDRGFQLAIATGKSRRGLNRVLAGLGMTTFFHASRCADETASKPHPQMLFELLRELCFEAPHALMIGDTEYDMDMARRAAVPRVAVTYGAHHAHRLLPYEPALCLDAFPEILSLVK